MLKKKFSPSVLNWIYLGIFTLSLLLLTLCFFVNTSFYNFSGESIWGMARLIPEYYYFETIAFLFVGFFIADIIFYGFVIFQILTKKTLWKPSNLIYLCVNIAFISIYMVLSIVISLYESPVWLLILFTLLVNGAGLTLYLLHRELKTNQSSIVENIKPKKEHFIDLDEDVKGKLNIPQFSKTGLFVINTVSMVLLFIFMFIPILTYREETYNLWSALSKICTIEIYAISIVMYIFYIVSAVFYISTISSYLRNKTEFVINSRRLNKVVLLAVSVNFIAATAIKFVYSILQVEITTGSLFPLLLTLVLSLVFAFFQGHITLEKKEKEKKKRSAKLSVFPLIFVILFSAVTICSIFLNFIDVNFEIFSSLNESYKFTGIELLRDYAELNEIFQIFAFIYAVVIFVSSTMLFLTLFSFLGKSKDYYSIAKRSAYTNFILTCILALLCLFFIFNQKIMDQSIQVVLEYLDFNIGTVYSYKISSPMIYVCLVSLLLLIIMLVTRQLNHVTPKELESNGEPLKDKVEVTLQESDECDVNGGEKEFDPCLAFTELDELKSLFIKNFKERQNHLFENPSLPNLVDFIVNYARESRLHLFYTFEEIATFIAGIGSSRLSILQGMSGTGKTSLPKIFMEAIMGKCDLIEVESSWRDKNELIGYYNEFSKRFTPRKFTQALYTAKLNPGIPTFIVLDEMNLSRIEYYFSDFLSLMEAEEKYREIKLLNIKIAPQGNPNKTAYFGLKNGHTLKIPSNVWFIGTANQDESTFEISDKVYDRAQTMNFNKRATKAKINNEQIQQKFWSYEMLAKLFIDAKNSMEYDAESDLVIQEVEKLLVPYNVSFGNRSLIQIEEFVKIYCSCFEARHGANKNQIMKDAVENVLISKVIRKLSTKQLDNVEKLAKAFDKLGLLKCSSYIRTLDEA